LFFVTAAFNCGFCRKNKTISDTMYNWRTN
jgi:hypothetical protein